MVDSKLSYTKSKQALEDVVAKMQSEGIDIDESLKLHQEGLSIADELITYVNEAETKITKLKADWEKKATG